MSTPPQHSDLTSTDSITSDNDTECPSAAELLASIRDHDAEKITIGECLDTFREGGFSLLIMLFAAPLALPLPAVGVATVIAIPIMILSLQLMMGRATPWMPKKWAAKELSMTSIRKVTGYIIPLLHKIEWLLKPRLTILTSNIGHKITGLACVICTISVALPIPFSNTVPSAGIVLMMIGLLERDGLAIIGGMILGALGITLTIIIYSLGIEVVTAVFYDAKDWFTTIFSTETTPDNTAISSDTIEATTQAATAE